MSNVVSILIVPSPGDPLGLLAPGLCGAMPPRAWRPPSGDDWKAWDRTIGYVGEDALPLLWRGAPVWDGLDRLRRATGGRCDMPDSPPTAVMLAEAGYAERREGVARVVYLDAEGKGATP